jgi:hypothetical protein
LDAEQGGLEVMGGCLGLLALLFGGMSAAVIRLSLIRRKAPERQRLNELLIEFCTGTDQSLTKVNQIRSILMVTFEEDHEHEDLLTATGSFAPGGNPPFHDEEWLEGKFRTFLRSQGIALPEYGKEKPGVWPPPPNFRL